jgi:hypothetical protein
MGTELANFDFSLAKGAGTSMPVRKLERSLFISRRRRLSTSAWSVRGRKEAGPLPILLGLFLIALSELVPGMLAVLS